ncbi:TlpA family protein disulfide reductase [Methylocucumis oryzae]|uniref:Redoxin n=1 Tax=Methylocucumis oryzae TaxID=1632867 RepID=A0A0F3IHB6_9GAMM|nr:TlpA disulfide reductase family protein [Methylocucumis oryzae]KJV06180.1 redoxin [Methylocucumis oryzae]
MNYFRITSLLAVGLLSFTAHAIEIGANAPLFTLPDLAQAQPVTLKNYTGKVVYLDFWASWCAPCRVSFPLLEELHKKLKSQGFEVVAVNLDETKDKAQQFLRDFPVGFTVLHDASGEWADKYTIESMPTSFIIDKHGVVRYIHHGFTSDDIKTIEAQVTDYLKAN